jgi:hypothetical protein
VAAPAALRFACPPAHKLPESDNTDYVTAYEKFRGV